jgi:hypothetical protein
MKDRTKKGKSGEKLGKKERSQENEGTVVWLGSYSKNPGLLREGGSKRAMEEWSFLHTTGHHWRVNGHHWRVKERMFFAVLNSFF